MANNGGGAELHKRFAAPHRLRCEMYGELDSALRCAHVAGVCTTMRDTFCELDRYLNTKNIDLISN
jgi:hypothetical protein